MVHVKAKLTTTSLGSVTGDIRITGLPFTSDSTADSESSVVVGSANFIAVASSEGINGVILPNTSYIVLHVWDKSAGTTIMQGTEWTADGTATFSTTYYV